MQFTGIGSWPGSDVDEAQRTVVGLTAGEGGIPHLVELPALGPAGDMIGRAAGMLIDLPVAHDHGAWHLTDVADTQAHLARAFLGQGIDVLVEQLDGWQGPLKLQATGPWTLAAILHLPTGNPVLSDAGATQDLQDSLREGIVAHVADVQRQIPGATILLQLDEPMLAQVVGGLVAHRSGLWRLPAVPSAQAVARLREFAPDILHSCSTPTPLDLLEWAPRLAVDVRGWDYATWERARETVAELWPGGADAVTLQRQWEGDVVVTPPCGLAFSPDPRGELRRCRDVVAELEDRRA